MEISKYAPVIIPTLNRIEHLQRCVCSLAKCTHAEKTELIISIDFPPADKYIDGNKQIKEYVKTIDGFAKVTIIEHDHNLGAVRNWEFCNNYCKDKWDCYIASEDDNEFAQCFLDFMNKAFVTFNNNEDIISVCGFNQPQYIEKGHNVIFITESSAWGVGYWSSKEISCNVNDIKNSLTIASIFNLWHKYPMLLYTLLGMILCNNLYADSMITYNNIEKKRYQIRPSTSLVRNCGHDGSGQNCVKNDYFAKMVLPKETEWEKNFDKFYLSSHLYKKMHDNMMSPRLLYRIKQHLAIFKRVISYVLTKG